MNNNTKEYGYIRVSSKTQNVARKREGYRIKEFT